MKNKYEEHGRPCEEENSKNPITLLVTYDTGENYYMTLPRGQPDETVIDEIKASGTKISTEMVIFAIKDKRGNLVWLERGHLGEKPCGLAHILESHKTQFGDIGIETEYICDFLLSALLNGDICEFQGKTGIPRPVYEFTYNEKICRVAIQVSDNGYIVSANPA